MQHPGRVWRVVRDGLNRTPAPAPRPALTSLRACCAHGMRARVFQNGHGIASTARGTDLPRRIPTKGERCGARLFDSPRMHPCTRDACRVCTSGRGRGSPGVSPSSVHLVVEEGTSVARVMRDTFVKSWQCFFSFCPGVDVFSGVDSDSVLVTGTFPGTSQDLFCVEAGR